MGFLKSPGHGIGGPDLLGGVHVQDWATTPPLRVTSQKIETLEKRKPGTIQRCSRPTPRRTTASRRLSKISREYLKAKPEYVVNTSECDNVKARLMAMENRHQGRNKDLNKPQYAEEAGQRDDGRTTGATPRVRRTPIPTTVPTLKRR